MAETSIKQLEAEIEQLNRLVLTPLSPLSHILSLSSGAGKAHSSVKELKHFTLLL